MWELAIEEALRIPGRGTVLIATEVPANRTLHLGDTLFICGHRAKVRGIEMRRVGDRSCGIVVANDVLPKDLDLPATATVNE